VQEAAGRGLEEARWRGAAGIPRPQCRWTAAADRGPAGELGGARGLPLFHTVEQRSAGDAFEGVGWRGRWPKLPVAAGCLREEPSSGV
jgi:hypothetical protein